MHPAQCFESTQTSVQSYREHRVLGESGTLRHFCSQLTVQNAGRPGCCPTRLLYTPGRWLQLPKGIGDGKAPLPGGTRAATVKRDHAGTKETGGVA